jgi:probable phosphomutase (TIGR03848 family)
MRALLIRHGVTGETGRILTGRLPGVGLSDKGKLDARIAADRLASSKLAAIYSSPIRRCRETARIIATPHDLTPLTERRVVEADYGTWSGRNLRDLYRLKAWDRLMGHAARFRFPEGETLTEVQSRAVEAMEELASRHGTDTIAVVSHSDVIRTLLCHYLGSPLDLIHRLHVGPTSLSVVDLGADGAVQVPVVNQQLEASATP